MTLYNAKKCSPGDPLPRLPRDPTLRYLTVLVAADVCVCVCVWYSSTSMLAVVPVPVQGVTHSCTALLGVIVVVIVIVVRAEFAKTAVPRFLPSVMTSVMRE